MISRIGQWCLVLGLLYLVSGCAGVVAHDDASTASKRSQARWNALIKGDMAEVYSYLSPATRSTMTLENYSRKYRIGLWEKATAGTATCEMERCKVPVLIVLKGGKGVPGLETSVEEIWVKDASNWWYVWK